MQAANDLIYSVCKFVTTSFFTVPTLLTVTPCTAYLIFSFFYFLKGINNKPRALEYWDEDYEKLEASSLDFGAKRSADDGDDPELNERGKKPKLYSRSREDFHEFDVFCHSLAIQLKRMPLERALLCQQKLQHVMTEERLEQLASCRETEESESASPAEPQLTSPAEPRESSAEFEERPTTTGFDVKQEKLDDV